MMKEAVYIYEYGMSGEFVISSVLSHHSKNLKRRMNQCYISVLLGKTKDSTPLRNEDGLTQKSRKEKRGLNSSSFPFLCICLLIPEPALCKLG